MNEGHIFAGYYRWLERVTSMYNKKGKKIGHYAIFKPLGGCPVCMNVWVCFFSFIFVVFKFELDWWWVLPYVFMGSFLFLIIKKTNE